MAETVEIVHVFIEMVAIAAENTVIIKIVLAAVVEKSCKMIMRFVVVIIAMMRTAIVIIRLAGKQVEKEIQNNHSADEFPK